EGANVAGFVALAAGSDFELDLLTFVQGLVTLGLDLGEVDEHVGSVLTGDEPVTLFCVEELHGADGHGGTHFSKNAGQCARLLPPYGNDMRFAHTDYLRGVTRDISTHPGDFVFRHDIRVRFAETDAMGIVHHSRYLPYLEEARVEYLRSIGHPYDAERADGVDYAVLEAHVAYRQPLHFDEVVSVHLVLSAATRATFTIDYLLTVGDPAADGAVRSTARTVHGCVNQKGRPVRLPGWLKEMVAELE
ncbi:MAG: hypothetical protein RLZ86_1656, partial [Actinomycetota bacterium]